jgi:hypothetical protein
MEESKVKARLKELDPRLERVYHDAKAVTRETADSFGDDFQLAAMITRLFQKHFKSKEARAPLRPQALRRRDDA